MQKGWGEQRAESQRNKGRVCGGLVNHNELTSQLHVLVISTEYQLVSKRKFRT